MTKYLIACALASALISTSANAAIIWTTGERRIDNVYAQDDRFTIFVDGNVIGGTCSSATATRMHVLATDPNYEAKVSALLLAFSGQLTVRIAYDDTTLSDCSVVINRFQVYRSS